MFDRTSAYIRAQIIHNRQNFIIPKLAAAALDMNDGEAFILLDLLAQEDLLRRVYNVYCRKNGILLATVDALEALDTIPHCDFCDKDHDPSDLKVEIAFVLKDDELLTMAA